MSNEEFEALKAAVEEILYMADASADGHDEINEHTPDAYIKLLQGRIDAIHEIAKTALVGAQPIPESRVWDFNGFRCHVHKAHVVNIFGDYQWHITEMATGKGSGGFVNTSDDGVKAVYTAIFKHKSGEGGE